MDYLLLLAAPIVVTLLWWGLAWLVPIFFPPITNKRICLLIAHPDDEAMFFSPTVVALSALPLNNHFQILCLCSGEDKALRNTRREELLKSATILGLRSSEDVTVLNDDRFQDSMTVTWDASQVSEVLSQKFVTPTDAASPKLDLDVLITFDNKGISSHDNHISLYHGALHWLNSLGQAAEDATLYSLTTTNIVRKYTSLLDAPITIALNLLSTSQAGIRKLPNQLVFLSGFWGYRKAQKAMRRGHQSQMLWFRYGWIGLSRYVGVNDLKKKWPVQ